MMKIHYIMDPQCGWCYAAAPLVAVLADLPQVDVKIYGGGLFSGAQKRPLSEALHQQIKVMDKRITALTGQVFSQTYYATLFSDTQRVLDSDTPITSLLAAEFLGIDPVAMLHKMQIAQFIEGRSLADINVIAAIAEESGVLSEAFKAAFKLFSGEKTTQHIAQARSLLDVIGGNGFPTFALENADGKYIKLDHSRYYGQPEAWLKYIEDVFHETHSHQKNHL